MADINSENRLAGTSSQSPTWPFPLILFSRQWWLATLLVLVAMGVMIRLGFWQLDRLDQRRARNAEITQKLSLPPLPLSDKNSLPNDLAQLKDRRVMATGEFDFSNQVALKLQNWEGAPGSYLITPLILEDSQQAVLVSRGWIPEEEASPEQWSQFDEPGPVTVTGFVILSEALPQNVEDTVGTPQREWFRVDIEAIQSQLPYEILPVYIQQSPPDSDNTTLPYRVEPNVELTDGPHLSYAIQWFIFALILGGGYIKFVSKERAKGSQ